MSKKQTLSSCDVGCCPYSTLTETTFSDEFVSSGNASKCPFIKLNLVLILLFQTTVLFVLAVPDCGVSYIITCVGFPALILLLVVFTHARLAAKLLVATVSKFLRKRLKLVVKIVVATLIRFMKEYTVSVIETVAYKLLQVWHLIAMVTNNVTQKIWIRIEQIQVCLRNFFNRSSIGDQLQSSSQHGSENPSSYPVLAVDTSVSSACYVDDDNEVVINEHISLFREGGSSNDNSQEQDGSLVIKDAGARPKQPLLPNFNPPLDALINGDDPHLDPPKPPPILDPEKTGKFPRPVQVADNAKNELELEETYQHPVPEGGVHDPLPPLNIADTIPRAHVLSDRLRHFVSAYSYFRDLPALVNIQEPKFGVITREVDHQTFTLGNPQPSCPDEIRSAVYI